MKKFLFLFLCVLATLTGCGKTEKHEIIGSQYITNENRDLIGGETLNNNNFLDKNTEQYVLEDNPLINNVAPEIRFNSALSSNFIVKEENNKYITPEIIGTNGSVSVFTKKDNRGWTLNKGQTLKFNFNKYKSKIVENQTVIIGYIINGKIVKGSSFKELSGSYQITANEAGEYYIYILNASSDYVAFKEGDITIS